MVRKRKTKNTKIPKQLKIATMDFETDPFKFGREPEPFCAGIFDGEVYRQFWGSECVINIVELLWRQFRWGSPWLRLWRFLGFRFGARLKN